MKCPADLMAIRVEKKKERENEIKKIKENKKRETIKFCEEYLMPIFEKKFTNIDYSMSNIKIDFHSIGLMEPCRHYTYKYYRCNWNDSYYFDLDFLIEYLDNHCYKTETKIWNDGRLELAFYIDPKCLEKN